MLRENYLDLVRKPLRLENGPNWYRENIKGYAKV